MVLTGRGAHIAIHNPKRAVDDIHEAQRPVQGRGAAGFEDLSNCGQWRGIEDEQDEICQ